MKSIKITLILFPVFSLLTSCCDEEMQNESTQSTTVTLAPLVHFPKSFLLKAANNMFLAIGSDSVLYASAPDSLTAESFEAIDMGNGKMVIKASTGKFLSDNLSAESKIDAIRNNPSAWEYFEIASINETTITLKGVDGKFVSADLGAGGVISAIRENASSWEEFRIVAVK